MPLEMRLAALAVLLPLVRAQCTQDADAMCPAFVESVGTHRSTQNRTRAHTEQQLFPLCVLNACVGDATGALSYQSSRTAVWTCTT